MAGRNSLGYGGDARQRLAVRLQRGFWGVAVVLLLAACATPSAPSTPDPGDGKPRSGGAIKAWATSDPASWDVSIAGNNHINDKYESQVYDSLLGFKFGPGVPFGDLTVRPELAERWEVSPDATTFTFHLRKGVKFTNHPPVNGRELASADVKFTFEYMSRTGEFKDFRQKNLPPSRFSEFFQGMEAIETPDPYTVNIRFKQPFAPFLNYVSTDYLHITPREIYDKEGSFENVMIGTGPFILDEAASQRGTRWVLAKNPGYWQPGKPYIDKLEVRVVPEASSAFAAFQVKQLDLLGGTGGHSITPQEAKQITAANPNAVKYDYLAPTPLNIYMNVRRAPFNDVRIRRAVSLALDREDFIRTFSEGEGGIGLAGALQDTFTQEEVRRILKHDPVEAKRLVAEAGYPNGLDVEFFASQAYGQTHLSMAQLMQSQLKKAGINLTIKMFGDHVQYVALTRGDSFDITFRGKNVKGDIDSYVYGTFHPSDPNNYGGVNDPKLTSMLEAQRREPDPAKRREIIREAVRHIADQAWGLAVFFDKDSNFWQPYVKNYTPNWGVLTWPVVETWLEN